MLYDPEGVPRVTQRIAVRPASNWMDVFLFNGTTYTVHSGALQTGQLSGMSAGQMMSLTDPTPVYDAMDRLMLERLKSISNEDREATQEAEAQA